MITEKEIESHIVNFFRAYLSFAETGDNPLGFNTYDGLCICRYRYIDSLSNSDLDADTVGYILEEMLNYLMRVWVESDVDDPSYPFGMRAYLQRYNTHTQHEDPARLQFIRNFIAAKAP